MKINAPKQPSILSGIRTTGKMHLGNYHGALKNWLKLQQEYKCFFCAADLHALTTDYASPNVIPQNTWDMIIDWLAIGIDPKLSHIFIQSQIPEHAELHLLLSMITPLGWLERVPTYKDQQQKLKDKDLSTYGFLGYPLLQAADVLLYKASYVPVGQDQVPHVEMIREIARRFNHLYGQEINYKQKLEEALQKLSKQQKKQYQTLLKNYQEKGSQESLQQGRELIKLNQNLATKDQERLLGHLEGSYRIILPEPEPLLTDTPILPGIDGQKMSKSYHNTIELREDPKSIEKKILTMPTDPARIRRTDPGNPEKCTVWQYHKIYSDKETQDWVCKGCRNAGIGCIDCKKPVANSIIKQCGPIREKITDIEKQPEKVKDIINEGNEAARQTAQKTIKEVKEVMGLPN